MKALVDHSLVVADWIAFDQIHSSIEWLSYRTGNNSLQPNLNWIGHTWRGLKLLFLSILGFSEGMLTTAISMNGMFVPSMSCSMIFNMSFKDKTRVLDSMVTFFLTTIGWYSVRENGIENLSESTPESNTNDASQTIPSHSSNKRSKNNISG